LQSRSLTLLFACAIVALAVLVPFAQSPALTLLSKDGTRQLPIAIVSNQEFVALDDLAGVFQLAVHEEGQGAITVTYHGRTIVLTADQSLASVAGRLISLPAPPVRNGRRWLVPVEFISRALGPIYDSRIDLRKPSHLLIVGDLRVPRVTVRYDVIGTGARLTIDATPRATSTVSQDGDHLTVKFDADALDITNPPLPSQGAQGLVLAVRVADPTTLVVDLGPRFAGFRAASQPVDAAMRQVVDFIAAQTDAQAAPPQPPPTTAPAPPPELPPSFSPPVPTLRTIVVDPGHGGDDQGAQGETTKEKDLAMAVARRLKAAIESRLGVRVLLTRDDDRLVPIDDRPALANNNKADLFISLHANASMRRSASGATVYSAAFDSNAAAQATPGERVPTFGGGLREIDLVPWDLAQTRHIDESTMFAGLLERTFRDRVPLANRAVDRAPLRVLQSANMPAVLIEMGYLTNPEQEKLLSGDSFQNALVQSVYDAIVRFRDTIAGGTR